MEYYTSVAETNEQAILSILKLHTNGKIELDSTYSKGNFYKGEIAKPQYKFDLFPQTDDTIQANAKNIPLPDSCVNTIMFDPPFLATTGASLNLKNDSNKINKRFGVFSSEKELHQFYIDAMKEQYRLLKDNGILIFKCQDKISAGKQYMTHCFVINEATKIGFYVKDLIILLAKNRIIANWQKANQKHFRKYHSYFLVLEKSNRKFEYI
jgi:hypothetical protein